MVSFFYLTKRPKKMHIKKPKVKFHVNTKPICVLMVCVTLGVLISYLVQANSIATKGYQIKELEQKMYTLERSSRDLESQALRLQSIQNISSKIDSLDMEVAKGIEYLVEENKFASNR